MKVKDVLSQIDKMTSASPDAEISFTDGQIIISEPAIVPEQNDITDKIKTFEDAYEWCKINNKYDLIEQFNDAINVGLQRSPDVIAYMKLRIVTAALNEGDNPNYDSHIYEASINHSEDCIDAPELINYYFSTAIKLCFKSQKLAKYAAEQFRDIYADFCGCPKNDNITENTNNKSNSELSYAKGQIIKIVEDSIEHKLLVDYADMDGGGGLVCDNGKEKCYFQNSKLPCPKCRIRSPFFDLGGSGVVFIQLPDETNKTLR